MTDEGLEHQTRAVYMISAAAELAGIHPQTIRDYERRGLVDPARSAGNTRRYSGADVTRLQRIVGLTRAGVNLEGVRLILELESQVAGLRELVEAARAELETTRSDAITDLEAIRRSHRRELMPFVSRVPAVRSDTASVMGRPETR